MKQQKQKKLGTEISQEIIEESSENYEPEILVENNDITSKEDIEQAFSDLLDSILEFDQTDESDEVNFENGFGLQSIDNIEEAEFTNCDKIFEDLYNELAGISTENDKIQNIQNQEPEIEEKTTDNIDSQLEELLNGISIKSDDEEESKNKILTVKELDDLMENILNSISEDDEKEENTITQNLAMTTVQEGDFLDKCIDTTANFFKVVWDGCKKLGILIKQKARELIGEEK